jgi:hypothetical protein
MGRSRLPARLEAKSLWRSLLKLLAGVTTIVNAVPAQVAQNPTAVVKGEESGLINAV